MNRDLGRYKGIQTWNIVLESTLAGDEQSSYRSWKQVAGYFDGDGNVGVEVVKYVLRFKLRFSDTWMPQIRAVKAFLERKKISTTNVWQEKHSKKRDAYRIEIGAIESALRAAKELLPYCSKKAEDLRVLIDYLEGRITGNKAIERLNFEVVTGRRSGFIRDANLPQFRKDGLRLAQLENARKARAAHAIEVNLETQERIRNDWIDLGLSHIRLSKKYGYSVSVIRRILGKR
jgi:hypothetical protein